MGLWGKHESYIDTGGACVRDSVRRGNAAGLAPAAALKNLEEGNARFRSGAATHCTRPNKLAELAVAQHPHTIVLSCSDSRVPPELVFDQGLGDIFTVRVAGNIAEASELASIEYAVETLGARLILVLGHESCGAVKAALSTPVGTSAGSPDLDRLIASISAHLKPGGRSPASKDTALRQPVRENVDGVAADLVAHSKIVKAKVDAGDVKIAKGIYSLETGSVEWF